MNPNLARLRPCPFEKLRQLFVGVTPKPLLREIRLSIGGLASYPTTLGRSALRCAIADRTKHHYDHAAINPEAQIIHFELAEAT